MALISFILYCNECVGSAIQETTEYILTLQRSVDM